MRIVHGFGFGSAALGLKVIESGDKSPHSQGPPSFAKTDMRKNPITLLFVLACAAPIWSAEIELPKVLDPRLKIELFAESPQIVTPTGIAVDNQGRVLCIESHTHFRPEGYQGPPADRIRRFEDTDGDGRADRITTFYEGTTFTMSVSVHHDDSVFVATRNEIFRLRDTDGDGRADERENLVRLDTTGNYPHNGLSGFAFDAFGHFYFGLGENLGADYKLIGSDGATLAGGGEGGNIFRCRLDGGELQRVATGFWNPFHVGFDNFGRLFAVDNDPDWRPPCRLLHIVPGGDYGYRFRYGRRGTHPFTSWFGDVPGTLGMVAGTGEAPCGVLAYQSDNLPAEYCGDLLVTSWGFHALERYRLQPRGATFGAAAETVIKGGENFRPVGISLAPDGSLYLSDWVLRSYNLHGQGRIWRISAKDESAGQRPTDLEPAFRSPHRPLSESAARKLAGDESAGRTFLRQQLQENDEPRLRALALTSLVAAGDTDDVLRNAIDDSSVAVRALAVDVLPESLLDAPTIAVGTESPLVRAAALRRIQRPADREIPLRLLADSDPWVQQAARLALARSLSADQLLEVGLPDDPLRRLGVALLLRDSGDARAQQFLPKLLADADPRVRFVAVQWVGEAKLKQFESSLADGLKTRATTGPLFEAYLASLDMLRNDRPGAQFESQQDDIIASLITRADISAPVLILCLRKLQDPEARQYRGGDHPALTVERLSGLLKHDDVSVRLEAVRALGELSSTARLKPLIEVATNSESPVALRAAAIVGIGPLDPASLAALLDLAESDLGTVRDEALRSLRGASLTDDQRQRLQKVGQSHREALELVTRALDAQWKATNHPSADDTVGWQQWLDDAASRGGDAEAGRRIFFHPQGPRCYACHQIEGRGGAIGPDLSTIGKLPERRILESIVAPSSEVAPQFVPWTIVKTDGRVVTGVLVTERGEDQLYADAQGTLFHVKHSEIDDRQPQNKSIMPDGLVDQLTDRELRDLLALLRGLAQ